MDGLIYTLIIGAVSGWLAGVIKKGHGFGLIGNIIVGIVGAWLGGWLFAKLGVAVASGTLGVIITSVAGALVLLFVVGLFKKG